MAPKPSEKPYSSISLLPKRRSTSRLVSRRSGEPAHSRLCSDEVSKSSKPGCDSTIKNCAGTMKLWLMRSRCTVARNSPASNAGITTQVPPTNSAGSITSQVPLE